MFLEIEYIARKTLQQNGQVEIGIFVLTSRGRASMAAVHVPKKFPWIFQLAMETACATHQILVIERKGVKKPKILFIGGVLPCFVP